MCDVGLLEVLWCAGFDFLYQLNQTIESVLLDWLITAIRLSITGHRPCDW